MKRKSPLDMEGDGVRLDANGGEPLLAQIASHYRRQILNGSIAQGTRLPTCQELGRRLGLAPQTINRAFELLAQEGLVHRRRSLGTIVGRPSFEESTSQEPTPRRRNPMLPVCLVMRKLSLPSEEEDIAHDYLNGLMEGFDAWKCRFEIAYLQPDQPDVELVRMLVETGQVRGMINMGLDREATDYLVNERFPMVMVNADLTARGVASVMADHVAGYREAWKHVSELGHRHAAFFGLENGISSSRLRECRAGRQLVEGACELSHSVLSVDTATPGVIWDALVAALGPWRKSGGWPTVFFAQTDVIATRLIRALHEHGLRIPQDVSVIGFNDSLIACHFDPPLTTLAKPRVKMGLAATQLLLDILAKRPGSADRLQVFPVQLVRRETDGTPNQ